MNTKVTTAIVIIVLILLGGWFFFFRQAPSEKAGEAAEEGVLDTEAAIPISAGDTTTAVEKDLGNIDIGDNIESEFGDIDAELQGL